MLMLYAQLYAYMLYVYVEKFFDKHVKAHETS